MGKDGLDTPGGREREQWGASIKTWDGAEMFPFI